MAPESSRETCVHPAQEWRRQNQGPAYVVLVLRWGGITSRMFHSGRLEFSLTAARPANPQCAVEHALEGVAHDVNVGYVKELEAAEVVVAHALVSVALGLVGNSIHLGPRIKYHQLIAILRISVHGGVSGVRK